MNFARRIVFDTGVLISAALRPQSIPALALEKALLQFELCMSAATRLELETVLRRPKFDAYLPGARRDAFLTGLLPHCQSFTVDLDINDCPDPKDNIFLALALVADAELIVSSDPHLTQMHPWRGIPIMPPAAFLVGIR